MFPANLHNRAQNYTFDDTNALRPITGVATSEPNPQIIFIADLAVVVPKTPSLKKLVTEEYSTEACAYPSGFLPCSTMFEILYSQAPGYAYFIHTY
ncbi:unnamed protein product [Peniophora sp. CBMAI 1063]|nr:unnamed protein product [Peniophora sp. CBMAI 1063]